MGDKRIFARKIREGFVKKYLGHTNWLILNNKGGVKGESINRACLYELFASKHNKTDRIFIGLPRNKDSESWVTWVITDSPFAEAFKTNHYEDGISFGFELDTHKDASLVAGAAMAVRYADENPKWHFNNFLELGMSGVESYALASNYRVMKEAGEKLFNIYASPNSNHLVVFQDEKFKSYEGENFKPCGESFWELSDRPSVSFRWNSSKKANLFKLKLPPEDMVEYKVKLSFGETHTLRANKLTKENCEKIISYMKGIK